MKSEYCTQSQCMKIANNADQHDELDHLCGLFATLIENLYKGVNVVLVSTLVSLYSKFISAS
jgi:hypothetical protein